MDLEEKTTWTYPALVRRQAVRYGEGEFMSFQHGSALTFAGYERQGLGLAHALAALGVGAGDRVMVLVKNRLEFMVIMLAALRLGAVFVPVNTELKGSFLEHQLRNSDPKVVFADAELLASFDEVSGAGTAIAALVVVAGDVAEARPAVFDRVTTMAYHDLAAHAAADDHLPEEPGPYDLACIVYTSGTSGPSKGVMMPHAHLVLWGITYAPAVRMTAKDRLYVCTPLFHMSALGMQVIGALVAGASVACVERFSPTRWIDEVRSSGATIAGLVGVLGELIYRTPARADDGANSLRTVFTAAIPEDLAIGFARRFGVELVQGYGQTECNMVTYSVRDDPLTLGCVGRPLDRYFDVRIVDPETDEPLAVGELGEIVVRPKEPSCFMQGYYRMPEKTTEAWRNLWLHTGDAGRFDAAGRLFFIDRIKDRIRRRGENISAFEIEEVLSRFAPLEECVAVGIRVEGAGGEDEIKACVVAKAGAAIDPVALLDFCVARMPRYAVPRFVEVLDELPKTASGKVQRQALRNRGVSPTTWDRETVGYTIARR
jgi:crotonobetaine/carnitine-CoA ligase